jgi:hypothetical protein
VGLVEPVQTNGVLLRASISAGRFCSEPPLPWREALEAASHDLPQACPPAATTQLCPLVCNLDWKHAREPQRQMRSQAYLINSPRTSATPPVDLLHIPWRPERSRCLRCQPGSGRVRPRPFSPAGPSLLGCSTASPEPLLPPSTTSRSAVSPGAILEARPPSFHLSSRLACSEPCPWLAATAASTGTNANLLEPPAQEPSSPHPLALHHASVPGYTNEPSHSASGHPVSFSAIPTPAAQPGRAPLTSREPTSAPSR